MEQLHHSLIVQVYRGKVLESYHQVEACVFRSADDQFTVFGQADRVTFPRSTLKLIQALPLVELYEKGQLSAQELTLACASHRGEKAQIEVVEGWQKRIQLDLGVLVCGFHLPFREADIERYFRENHPRTPLWNNCAGKHLGFCHWSLFHGLVPMGYHRLDHPAQQNLLANMKKLGLERSMDSGLDGCGVPNFAMTLKELTRLFARWMETHEGQVLIRQMRSFPQLISGEEGLDTWLAQKSGGKVLSKGGAEGLCVAFLPEHQTVVAVKALDGAARAAQAATLEILSRLPEVEAPLQREFQARLTSPLLNWSGESTGQIRVQGVALS